MDGRLIVPINKALRNLNEKEKNANKALAQITTQSGILLEREEATKLVLLGILTRSSLRTSRLLRDLNPTASLITGPLIPLVSRLLRGCVSVKIHHIYYDKYHHPLPTTTTFTTTTTFLATTTGLHHRHHVSHSSMKLLSPCVICTTCTYVCVYVYIYIFIRAVRRSKWLTPLSQTFYILMVNHWCMNDAYLI